MGANSSTTSNIGEQIIKSQINVLNKNISKCTQTGFQQESINVGPYSTFTNNGQINFSEVTTLDQTCLSNMINNTDVISDISEAATQVAKSVAQNFSPGTWSDANANNFVYNYIDTAINVTNVNYQKCLTTAMQSEQINVAQGATFVNSTTGVINFSESLNAASACTLTSSNNNSVTQSLSQTLSQIATAIVQNSLAILAIAAILIVVVFFLFDFGVANSLLNWKTLAVIFTFIILYILLAYFIGFWPFDSKKNNQTTPPTSNPPQPPPASGGTTMFDV